MSASREKNKRKEEFAQGINKQQVREQEAAVEGKRRKRSVTILVVILALVVAFFCVAFDCIPFFSGRLQKEGNAFSVGDTKFSAADFNYYFNTFVNEHKEGYGEYYTYLGIDVESEAFLDSEYSNGITWREFFKDYTLSQMTEMGYLINAAEEEGFELTEEQITEVDEFFEYLSSYADSLGMNIDEFYESQYGEGVTEDVCRRNMLRSTLATYFKEYKLNSFEYDDATYEAYYAENPNDVDLVEYNYFFMSGIVNANDTSTTSEEAMAKALSDSETFVERLESGESFYDLAYEYAREISKERYEKESASHRQGMNYTRTLADIREWLFDEERQEGDITILQGNPENTYEGYFVVEYLGRERAEYETVTYRNIKIAVDVETEDVYMEENADDPDALSYEDYVEQAWTVAENTVNSTLNTWKVEGGDEEEFAILATTVSTDGNYSEGGYNAQTYRYLQEEEEIDEWLFDEERQPGDYTVIEVSDGFQILYFVEYDMVHWKLAIRDILSQQDYDEWFATLDYEAKEHWFGMLYAMKD